MLVWSFVFILSSSFLYGCHSTNNNDDGYLFPNITEGGNDDDLLRELVGGFATSLSEIGKIRKFTPNSTSNGIDEWDFYGCEVANFLKSCFKMKTNYEALVKLEKYKQLVRERKVGDITDEELYGFERLIYKTIAFCSGLKAKMDVIMDIQQ